MELVLIYDELEKPYLCECEGARVIRIVTMPEQLPGENAVPIWQVTETDVRFGGE